MKELFYKIKIKFKISSIYYLIFFIAVAVTIFFLTSKLFYRDINVIKYEKNTLFYTSEVKLKDAKMLIETMKKAYYLNENTEDMLYLTKTKENAFLVMITEDSFRFNDKEETLYGIAKILSEGLKRSVEFGKCDDKFLKIKTVKYEYVKN